MIVRFKAGFPNASRFLGISALFKALQPMNADLPMLVMELGLRTVLRNRTI